MVILSLVLIYLYYLKLVLTPGSMIGLRRCVVGYHKQWMGIWRFVAISDPPALPPLKVFKPKHDLPILPNYRQAAPEEFWNSFPSNYVQPAISLVNGQVLQRMALETGRVCPILLQAVVSDITLGASIGCKGYCRRPTKASNAPSAYTDGRKVTDAIADWVSKGFAYGPLPLSDVPKGAKFSGVMTRPKPNGSVRIILNLSSPKGSSVNDGIDSSDFPTVMSSTTKWLRALHRAGKRCLMTKVDWADAYKHLAVRLEDTELQYFNWLGKAFKELSLVFGCASSAGLFDRLAKVVLAVVVFRAGIDPVLVIQHLDDCCAAGPRDSSILAKFDAVFAEVAAELGLRLAPRDDPEKSFAPSTQGVILGVYYDTVAWTWAIPHSKFALLLQSLKFLMDETTCPQEQIWSVVGKLIHVKRLVPGGHFNLYWLLRANSFSTDPKCPVPLCADLKRQVWFWFTMLQVCSGRASLPDPDRVLPAWSLDIFTDAAGGSKTSKGQGVGVVSAQFWSYVPWQWAINSGQDTGDFRRLDRIMSALELFGPLVAICAARKFCRGIPVRCWVDNAGSVFIYKKGYSTSCAYSSAIATAIATVAAGLGCQVELCKITRCSNEGALMADFISKGALSRFRSLADSTEGFKCPRLPLPVPLALLRWVTSPSPDFNLGHAILRELAADGDVLGY